MATQLTTDDFTYDLAKLAIFTNLEPLLGIIISCAPLFPPTFKAIYCRMSKWSPSSSSVRGFARLTTKGTTGLENQASNDSFPLVDVRGGRNTTKVTGPNSQPNSSHGSNAVVSDENARPQRTITVTKGWNIRTDMPKYDVNETV